MQKYTIVFFCALVLASCQTKPQKEEKTQLKVDGSIIVIPDDSPLKSKLELLVIHKELFSEEFHTVGTAKAITGQLAEVSAPFEGRVIKTLVQLGQKVNAGTPLFELSSPEFFDASKSYFQSQNQLNQSKLNYKREQDLVAHGVGVQKELEEAQAEYENAKANFEQETARMSTFHINLQKLTVGEPLRVISPIAGEVVKNNLVIGQYLKNDAGAQLVIANLDKIWVVALVKEKYFGSIKKDNQAEVYSDAQPLKKITGHIYHIGELLDEETRSVEVLIECENGDRNLKPGMFTSVHFIGSPKESIRVPSSAILQNEKTTYVFIKTGEGRYKKREVLVGSEKEGMTEVMDGLQDGETIVSKGGIYLLD